uniref:Uncharacterized protein n=1 Tax=Acrobeloides nanus TaxID=290746 RepID=A0A914DL01_9BILA
MKSIIQNQVERDEYHKMLEERKQQRANDEQKELINKMAEMNIYVPPHMRRSGRTSNETEAGTSNEPSDPLHKIREKARRHLKKQLDEELDSNSSSSISSSGSNRTWKTSRKPTKNSKSGYMFRLNVMDDLEVVVHKDDTPETVANFVCEKLKLDEVTKKSLVEFLRKEFTKHLPI